MKSDKIPFHCSPFKVFFLKIQIGEVLVPAHLLHTGGNHNCYIHSWLTYYSHKGKTLLKWPNVRHTCILNIYYHLFIVLLCNIKQQILQCDCAGPCSDHGEYVFFTVV